MSPRSPRAWHGAARFATLLVVLAAAPTPARADAPVAASTARAADPGAASSEPDARHAAAEEHFARGLALARAPGGWERALEEFLESRRLYPTRSATHNAAIASQSLGRYADALELYDSLLRDFAESIPEAEGHTFETERRALLEHFGKLLVRPSESGVTVVIDGSERGVSPLAAPAPLQAGSHVVRLSKDGLETEERQVFIAVGSTLALDVAMKPLVGARILVVGEASGEPLDVVLDAATVGRTPWRGNVSAGLHSVLLRGPGRGTAPVAVDLGTKPSASLTLRAVALDSELAVEPLPANATLYIDGAFSGSSGWTGSLPSGLHRVDAVAPGYLPFRRDLVLAPGRRLLVKAELAIDKARAPTLTRFYLEPTAGLVLARSLRGGVDDACDCGSRSRPFGWLAALHAGYLLTPHVAPELGGGFLALTERATRTIHAGSEPGTSGFLAKDARDSVVLSGPFGSVGAAARFLRRTPLTARGAVGLALLDYSMANAGTYSGLVGGDALASRASGRLAIPEASGKVLVPFASTELRIGYAFNARVSADFGTSATLFFPPAVRRTQRAGLLSSSDRLRVGVLTLPDERLMRTFVALSPSLAVRVGL